MEGLKPENCSGCNINKFLELWHSFKDKKLQQSNVQGRTRFSRLGRKICPATSIVNYLNCRNISEILSKDEKFSALQNIRLVKDKYFIILVNAIQSILFFIRYLDSFTFCMQEFCSNGKVVE
jgi:hypothetical protein